MSSNNLDDLKQLVTKSLEAKGILGKLRAQLRKHVIDVIDNQQTQNNDHNEKILTISNTIEKKMIINLFKDYLEFYGLDYTLSIFLSESQISTDELSSNYNIELSKRLNIDDKINRPLIESLIYNTTRNNINTIANQPVKISATNNNTNNNPTTTITEQGDESFSSIKQSLTNGHDIDNNNLFDDSLSSSHADISSSINTTVNNDNLTQQYQSVYKKNTTTNRTLKSIPNITIPSNITNNNTYNYNNNNDEELEDDSYAEDFQDDDETPDISISDNIEISISAGDEIDNQLNISQDSI